MSDKIIKVALLDMYNGERNQGMRCIIDVVNRFSPVVSFEIFDVRVKCELPDISKFDIDLYFALTEKIMVLSGGRLIISLIDGTDIECTIE